MSMIEDTQYWHFTKQNKLVQHVHQDGSKLTLFGYDDLIHPVLPGIRKVILLCTIKDGTMQAFEWFASDDLFCAMESLRVRMKGDPLVANPDHGLKRIAISQEEEIVADCRRKGCDLLVKSSGERFYVDFNGRRSQVNLEPEAVVRYLVNALEDGS